VASSRRRNFCHPCANLTPRGLPQDMHVSFPRGDTYLLPFRPTTLRPYTDLALSYQDPSPATTISAHDDALTKRASADSLHFRVIRIADKREAAALPEQSYNRERPRKISGFVLEWDLQENKIMIFNYSFQLFRCKVYAINPNFLDCSIPLIADARLFRKIYPHLQRELAVEHKRSNEETPIVQMQISR